MNLLESAPTVAAPAKDSFDRVLCLSEVAAFLSCNHEDARRFLSTERVPCYRLGSGGCRFLLSHIVQAIKENARPYEDESRRANEAVEAWEFWLSARSSDANRDLGVDWKSWLQLMADLRIMPDDFQHFELERKKELLLRARGNHAAAPVDGHAAAKPAAPSPMSTATTAIRGRYAERKAFE